MTNQEQSLVIIGNRKLAERVLSYLSDKGHSVVGAIGREQDTQAGYQSLSSVCSADDIPLIETNDINSDTVISFLQERRPDICLCCGWTQIISQKVLDIPSWGTIGVHASKLPEGRGGAPVNWQIIDGHNKVCVSVFEFTTEVDHGDILAQEPVSIEERDTIRTVYEKVTHCSMQLFRRVITEITEGTTEPRTQSFDDATYRPQRKPDDGLIDWDKSPEQQWNWIRAQTHPYPGAFTFLNEQKLKIWDSTIPDKQQAVGVVGEIQEMNANNGIDVRTGEGTLRLKRVQWEGCPTMWADDFAEMFGLEPGDCLGKVSDFPDWLYTGIRGPKGELNYKTNAPVGQTVQSYAVCCSHKRPREITVTVELDNKTISKQELTVDGWAEMSIKPTIPDKGSHTLTVQFEVSDSQFDTRRLKLYGTNGLPS